MANLAISHGNALPYNKHNGRLPKWPYANGLAVPFGKWSEITHQTQWDMANVAISHWNRCAIWQVE